MTPLEQINCYFANLNPVAKKIAFDIREVKSAYDHVWLTLSSIEQDDILNDTIIKPEITIRYYKNSISTSNTSKDVPRLNTPDNCKKKTTKNEKYNIVYAFDKQRLGSFIHQKVGLKIIHDENIGDYRDEHSFPFSYKTKSQINLSVIVSNANINIPLRDNDPCKPKPFVQEDIRNITPVRSDNVGLIKLNTLEQVEDKRRKSMTVENECTELTDFVEDEKCNLLYNSDSKNTLLGNSTDSTENDSENDTKDQHAESCKLLPEKVQIPKGFDFLSNW